MDLTGLDVNTTVGNVMVTYVTNILDNALMTVELINTLTKYK